MRVLRQGKDADAALATGAPLAAATATFGVGAGV
jgi:hypothetical protein